MKNKTENLSFLCADILNIAKGTDKSKKDFMTCYEEFLDEKVRLLCVGSKLTKESIYETELKNEKRQIEILLLGTSSERRLYCHSLESSPISFACKVNSIFANLTAYKLFLFFGISMENFDNVTQDEIEYACALLKRNAEIPYCASYTRPAEKTNLCCAIVSASVL